MIKYLKSRTMAFTLISFLISLVLAGIIIAAAGYGFFVHSQPLFRGFAGVADAGKDGCHTGNGAGGCAGVSGLAVRPA